MKKSLICLACIALLFILVAGILIIRTLHNNNGQDNESSLWGDLEISKPLDDVFAPSSTDCETTNPEPSHETVNSEIVESTTALYEDTADGYTTDNPDNSNTSESTPETTAKKPEDSTSLGILSVNSYGYAGVFDGNRHYISVSCPDTIITYSNSSGGTYSTLNPGYVDAGVYTVYYKVEKDGFSTVTGCETITINKADGYIALSSTAGVITYPNFGEFFITNNLSGGLSAVTSSNNDIVTASVSDNKVTLTPGMISGVATITVTSSASSNYNEASATYVATVENGILNVIAKSYVGTYDGTSHCITVSCQDANITYATSASGQYTPINPAYIDAGTYIVYYKVEMSGYSAVLGSETVTINKATGAIDLSSKEGTLAATDFGGFSVTTNKSGGELSLKVANSNVVTATISGNKIIIKPGAPGITTITVTSGSTNNYTEATTTYTITVEKLTLDVNAEAYIGIYDGKPHSVNIISPDATITYSTSKNGIYTSTKPSYTDAGTYTVYYRVEKNNYDTVLGSAIVTINKAPGKITLSETEGIAFISDNIRTNASFTVSENLSGGKLSVKGSSHIIGDIVLNSNTITVTPNTNKYTGEAVVTITAAATNNYEEASAVYTFTVNGIISETENIDYDGMPHGISVYYPGAVFTYSTSETGGYSETNPMYTEAGYYKTYYKAEIPGIGVVTGSDDFRIYEREGRIVLSSYAGSLVNNTSITFAVIENLSGGELSVESSDPSIATASICGNEISVELKSRRGAIIIYVKSEGIGNYKSTVAEFKVHTNENMAQAVYSSDDNSLRFYCMSDVIEVGSVYNGLKVTAVYTGFDTEEYASQSKTPWADYRKIIELVVVEDEGVSPLYTACWFAGFMNCSSVDVKLLDVSQVTSMRSMFSSLGSKCSSVSISGLENWNVSRVTNMNSMFSSVAANAKAFTLNLSSWNVSNVKDMTRMFANSDLNASSWSVGNIERWNVSNVEAMSSMFASAGLSATYKLNLSSWNVGRVMMHDYFNDRVGSKITAPAWKF